MHNSIAKPPKFRLSQSMNEIRSLAYGHDMIGTGLFQENMHEEGGRNEGGGSAGGNYLSTSACR